MTASDESILELLSERDVALMPDGIKVNLEIVGISISKRTIYRRLELLDEAGLVAESDVKDGYWVTTDVADMWLDGELGVDDIKSRFDD